MTDERIAIEALGRCNFSPGTWDKKFARNLAGTAENYTLTPRQRSSLWRLVVKYRRQLPPWLQDVAEMWLAVGESERALRNTIEANLRDLTPRRIYADWLDECGRTKDAKVQRWMTDNEFVPQLIACGHSYGPHGGHGINFEWTLGMEAWAILCQSPGSGYYNRSLEKMELALREVLSKQNLFIAGTHPPTTATPR